MTTIFLDRDGVINEDRPGGVRSWAEFRFVPGALDALRRLSDAGHQLIIVTNQSAIGKGLVSREAIDDIHSRMLGEITSSGGKIAGLFMCPHRPEDDCHCRKPKPGLFFTARDELGADLSSSVFIGDHVTDLEAGGAAGCKSIILVLTGRGRALVESDSIPGLRGFLRAPDLPSAAHLLLTSTQLPQGQPLPGPEVGLSKEGFLR